MKHIKYITAYILLTAFSLPTLAQDYFEDAAGNGFPVILNPTGGNFNIRLTPKDNSLKVNFFKFFNYKAFYDDKTTSTDTVYVTEQFKLPPPLKEKLKLPDKIKSTGAGFSIKGKTEQNTGSLFSSGAFSPGTVLSGYLATRKITLKNKNGDTSTKINTWLVSAQYAASSLRLFDVNRTFENMKIDTPFNGFSASVSFFQAKSVGKKKENNLIWGGSLEFAIKNNYSNLKTYEVKDFEVQITDPQTGSSRTVQVADDEGYGYSKNNYAIKKYFTLRPHVNYIPAILNYRVGVILYPSYVIIENSKPRTNFELAFHVLEKGSPVLSNLGIYFSLTDVYNGRGITNKTFMERSFSVGIGASFNMFTGKQK